MTNINICFLGDDSISKNVVGTLLHNFNKDYSFDIKDNKYYKIIEKLENERKEISDKSTLVWSFIIKNKQFNINLANKENKINQSFFNQASLADIGFVIYDLKSDKNRLSTIEKNKILIMNVLGIKNILVLLNNTNGEDVEDVKTNIIKMLKKRNYKDNKIFFFCLDNGIIDDMPYFVKTLSSMKLVNKSNKHLLMPINNVFRLNDKYMGINGRILSGNINQDQFIVCNPNMNTFKVLELQKDHVPIKKGYYGDNVGIKINYHTDISKGMIITNIVNNILNTDDIICQFISMQNNIYPDNECIFYSNFIKVNCVIKDIFNIIDRDNNIIEKSPESLKNKDNSTLNIKLRTPVCVTTYKKNNKLGSFVLMSKDEETILGVGLIKNIKH